MRDFEQDTKTMIHTEARRAYEDAGEDIKAATDLFEQRVRDDAALRDALTDPLIRGACYSAVTMVIRLDRKRVWTAPVYSGANGETNNQAGRVEALAQSNLMMFPLPGGKRLADATREEIAEASNYYLDRAKDARHKGAWLALIADRLPDGKAVRDAMTEKELQEMKDKANG